eukprot:TRINITY_DN2353_c0_g1_i1.p2 TRINITY_DN2353_c0_g1~~TRINITY_DN2353_c0_g1_i1.p2  ORF type:complete len:135 (+),score=14.48 TRINITY_DN2353_c0_g1_i1:64-468(+)
MSASRIFDEISSQKGSRGSQNDRRSSRSSVTLKKRRSPSMTASELKHHRMDGPPQKHSGDRNYRKGATGKKRRVSASSVVGPYCPQTSGTGSGGGGGGGGGGSEGTEEEGGGPCSRLAMRLDNEVTSCETSPNC